MGARLSASRFSMPSRLAAWRMFLTMMGKPEAPVPPKMELMKKMRSPWRKMLLKALNSLLSLISLRATLPMLGLPTKPMFILFSSW